MPLEPDSGAALPEVQRFGQAHGLTDGAQAELHSLVRATITLAARKVTVAVPGTVANMGPGIETCGLAVDVWDEITAEYATDMSLEVTGDAAAEVPRSTERNMAMAGVVEAFAARGRSLPAMRLRCVHRIPWGKGLGAESASFVGGYLAGSVLCAEELAALGERGTVPESGEVAARASEAGDVDALLQTAIARGWNPGNVCPAIYGALQIGIATPGGFRSHRVPVPTGVVCVILVPEAQPEGAPLPKGVLDRKSAIFNVGHMAFLVNSLCTNNWEMFAKAVEDSVGASHITAQFPYMPAVIQSALAAGAAGACPAGYGPSVLALITGRTGDVLATSSSNELERAVAMAMLAKADEVGCGGKVLIAKPADIGAHVVAQKSELGTHRGSERIIYFQ